MTTRQTIWLAFNGLLAIVGLVGAVAYLLGLGRWWWVATAPFLLLSRWWDR